MNILTLDVETSISNKGNPFDTSNQLVCVGVKWLIDDNPWQPTIFYDDYSSLQEIINRADLLVGFNIKFDLHWLRRAGISFSGKRVWDCQIGEFLLESQLNPYPSLNQACEKYGLPTKLDVVKTEYWEKGIDTPDIPHEILSEYLTQDLLLTEQVYLKQAEQFEGESKYKYPLFKLQNLDLLVLEEYEYNGIVFDATAARAKAVELEADKKRIEEELVALVGDAPYNLSSNDHVSAILYGGVIAVDTHIPVGVFKTGLKVGQPRYKIITKEYELPRLTEPLKGTETKFERTPIEGGAYYEHKDKPTHWKVNQDVMRSLKLNKRAKAVVDLLDKHSELEKLCGTYLNGWSDLILKMHWPSDMIHGNLNQTTVVTGRLSSTKPNLQNADGRTKQFMISRYVG